MGLLHLLHICIDLGPIPHLTTRLRNLCNQALTVEAFSQTERIFVGTAYRPPNAKLDPLDSRFCRTPSHSEQDQ